MLLCVMNSTVIWPFRDTNYQSPVSNSDTLTSFAICYDINQVKYYFRWGGSFLIKWIKILGMRYKFHCYVTFEGLELALSCF